MDKLAEILSLELTLYATSRDAEWQLSCYGLCEDAVLAEQFTVLAGIIDAVLGQLDAAGTRCVQRIAETVTVKMISRSVCYRQLSRLHRELMAHFENLTGSIPPRSGLLEVAEQAIAMHFALSEKLKFFFRDQQERSRPFEGPEEPVILFT